MNALRDSNIICSWHHKDPQVYLLTHTGCAKQNTETPRKSLKQKSAQDTSAYCFSIPPKMLQIASKFFCKTRGDLVKDSSKYWGTHITANQEHSGAQQGAVTHRQCPGMLSSFILIGLLMMIIFRYYGWRGKVLAPILPKQMRNSDNTARYLPAANWSGKIWAIKGGISSLSSHTATLYQMCSIWGSIVDPH